MLRDERCRGPTWRWPRGYGVPQDTRYEKLWDLAFVKIKRLKTVENKIFASSRGRQQVVKGEEALWSVEIRTFPTFSHAWRLFPQEQERVGPLDSLGRVHSQERSWFGLRPGSISQSVKQNQNWTFEGDWKDGENLKTNVLGEVGILLIHVNISLYSRMNQPESSKAPTVGRRNNNSTPTRVISALYLSVEELWECS